MRRTVLVLCTVFALMVGVATATAGGGNSANAKQCQKKGWQTLYRSDGSAFAGEEACVSYAATGGTLTTKPQSKIDCVQLDGSYFSGASGWSCSNFLVTSGHTVLQADCAAEIPAGVYSHTFTD